jgi:two-component system cell cycle sensor histidine kinase/response regulator CckA
METLRRVQAIAAGLPLIVLTGWDARSAGADALQQGAQDYLVKGRFDDWALPRALLYARERKKLEAELLRKERLAAAGTLASGVNHEFNNLNNIIVNAIELVLLKHPLPEDAERKLRTALQSAQKAAAISRNLHALVQHRSARRRPLRLGETVNRVLRRLRPQLEAAGARLQVSLADEAVANLDPEQFEQVVFHLVQNAAQALAGRRDGSLAVRAAAVAEEAHLEVSDTGCGIPRENLVKIFTPFFSTRGAYSRDPAAPREGVGPGLGLSICQAVVHNHGGRIEMESVENEGTTCRVRLPRWQGERAADRPKSAGAA